MNTIKKKEVRLSQLKTKRKWKKLGIKISKELRDIIHGYVMSDGYIRNGILTVEQSQKQRLFVMWLYDKLQPVRTTSPMKKVIRSHPKTQQKSCSLRFFTKAVLPGFHSMWYKPFVDQKMTTRYKKKLPKSIHCFFNETFLAVWFAGDGTKTIGSVGAKFEVSIFNVVERQKLKKLFFKKFGIQTQIISSGFSKNKNPQWALKVPAKEYEKFRNLIVKSPLIPTLFPYKLHKKP